MRRETAIFVVISLLLALIVRAALEALFHPLVQRGGSWGEIRGIAWLQCTVFFVLLLRFYLGSIRHASAEPKQLHFGVRAVNFVIAFAIFCLFYLIALSVARPDLFYPLVIVLHLVDACWFAIALILSLFLYQNLADDDVDAAAARGVMAIFFCLSIGTLVAAVIIYWWKGIWPSDAEHLSADYLFLVALVLLSVIDIASLHSYYFAYERWLQTHNVAAVRALQTTASSVVREEEKS
jgi:hypothetical protein